MNTSDFIHHTTALARIASTSDNAHYLRQAVDFVADFVSARANVTIERFESNGKPSLLMYRGATRPEKFDLLLNGHVDVVSANPEAFEPYEKDGRLYGRGVLDMKGTVIVLASVFCELVNEVPYAFGLQIVPDEETGGVDGTIYQIEQGVRTEMALIGEYANHRNTIYNAARGLCWAEIAFKGKTSHGGHPWNGSNAIVRASDFVSALLERYPIPTEETWTTTATIASITTPNDTYNKVPDYAVVKVDFRFPVEDKAFTNEESVRALIAEIDPEAELLSIASSGPAIHVEETNLYAEKLAKAIKEVTGETPQFKGRPGGSDGRHFALANMNALEFGLYGHNSHSPNEYVEIASFEEYYTVMRKFLRSL